MDTLEVSLPVSASLENFTLEFGPYAEIGMGLTLFIMMLAVALRLDTASFARVRETPKNYVAGVLGQIVLLPAMTVALCFALKIQAPIALGMILVACCPGGNVSNLFVLLARGNIALSVSLTATSSVLAAFITPFSILFWSHLYPPTSNLLDEIELDAVAFLVQTMLILALPLLIGMTLKAKRPGFAERIRQPLVWLSSFGLVVIIASSLIKYGDQLGMIVQALIWVVALHNACAFLLGFLVSKLVRADEPSQRTLTFEVGIQNAGLGIVIILSQLGGLGGAAAVVGLWGTWHLLAGLGLIGLFRLTDKAKVGKT